jgi:MYXO-CTERM domain-containing protein
VDEIVRLGEAYSIVTEHTSFLVLENDAEYRRWKIDRRNALRIERDRAAQARVRQELESLRSKAMADLGPTRSEKRQELRDQGEAMPGTSAMPAAQRSLPASTSPSVAPATSPLPPPQPRRGWDVDLGGGSSSGGNGGGAVDPAGLALALGLAGLALARRRRAGR